MISNKTIKHYPLSSPQLDFWFDQILHPDVPLYNIGGYVRIEGPIDPTIFEKALNQVIAENDALRIMLHEGE
ncbi:MAG: condensation domain-containing protein, partial [Candidatus Parabeggiatoa sp.]|nr:condensation domain-containing protein [Candidatus Parabeggiatoa sp.]